jgi:hypothetical protein
MTVARTVDLNAALVATGLVGPIAPRAALAHPRALAITNNGDHDDADETLYATEYFAQRIAPEAADGSNADVSKEGLVYRVSLADGAVTSIPLAPLSDLGFRDHTGGVAGCFPNQLQSITLNGNFAFVTSICASPKGPTGPFQSNKPCTVDADCEPNGGRCDAATSVCAVNNADVKTVTSPVVSVIDLAAGRELAGAAVNLNARFSAVFDAAKLSDDVSRRLPLFADDLAFVPGTGIAYVSASGADALFRLRFDGGTLTDVGSSTAPFIDLTPAGLAPPEAAGRSPIGVAVTNADHAGRAFALSANDVGRNATVVDLASQAILGGPAAAAVVATTALPGGGTLAEKILLGKRFFVTGTARWSLAGQAWGACQSCHGDGLTDNVTWYFPRGPRQSTSLDGSFSSKDPTDQRIFNWTAIFDEVADFEINTRTVSGGVGAIVSKVSSPPANGDRIDIAGLGHAGLAGSALAAATKDDAPDNFSGFTGVRDDWANITEYIRQLRSPRRPTTLDPAQVAVGRELFAAGNCQGCHGGDKWTISRLFYTPDKQVTDKAANVNQRLFTTHWTQPAGFPDALLPTAKASPNQLMRFAGADPAQAGAFDQIQCILRPVGTFGVAESGVGADGGFPELRVDMVKPAQGNQADGNGYNPPSLLGAVVGAPYLHAGQVRTLEALFDPTFRTHYQALNAIFLDSSDAARGEKVRALVAYLLAIDEDEPTVAIPAAGAAGGNFCAPPM